MSEVEIKPLRLARVSLPESHPAAPGLDVVHAFLVRDDANAVLVDTGVGSGNELIERLYAPEREDLLALLAAEGLAPGDLTAVVNSHLHFDHCGNNALFAGVPILVQAAELRAAKARFYTVPDWVDFPGARYVPLDGAHAISPRLELVPTPGHTPGHQSLLIRDGERTTAIVAQAAYTSEEFELHHQIQLGQAAPERFEPCLAMNASWSRDSYLASLDRLQAAAPRNAWFSHDPGGWERAE